MRLDVFCAWGDGPDVGLNIHRTPQEQAAWIRQVIARGITASAELVPLDFTAAEARALAAQLIACAEHAERLDRELAAFEARDRARIDE